MRIRLLLAVGVLGLLAPACKHKEAIPPPAEKQSAPDIPREIAIGKLKTLLPQTAEVHCTAPKESFKASEIQLWVVGNDVLEIRSSKGRPSLLLAYADITDTQLEKVGKFVHLRIFSSVQKEPRREHFTLVWGFEDSAKDALVMFEALRKKPQ
jgi:hypothetical protein